MRHRLVLSGILILYVVLCVRMVTMLPLWGGVVDENMHFGYTKYLVVKGQLPVIEKSNAWQQLSYPYLAPSAGTAAHHPPGYYFLGSLILRPFVNSSLDAQNYAVRAASLLLGLATLLVLYAAMRQFFPDRPRLALAAVACTAFFPNWLLVSSVIYPEIFGALGAAVMLLGLGRFHNGRASWESTVLAGVGVSCLAMSKMSMLPFCLAGMIGYVWVLSRSPLPTRQRLQHLAGFVGIGLLLCGWWYARNVLVYGMLFPTSEHITGMREGQQFVFKDGSTDMIAMLFVPIGQMYYKLALRGAFLGLWCPVDWLPPAARTPMYAIAAIACLTIIVGVVKAGRGRGTAVGTHPFSAIVVPFLGGGIFFFFLYLHWTVTVAIYANAEFGKWLTSMMPFSAFTFALSNRILWKSRAAAVIFGWSAFFLVWDVMAIYYLATVLIPQNAGLLVHP